MRLILIFLFLSFNCAIYAQDKYNYVHFNKLTEVEGTKYVIASIENWGKMLPTNSRYLLFINTENGETKQVDFPNSGYFIDFKQVKIDSLNINQIILQANTVDLNNKGGIDWFDPSQIIVLSPDGQQKTQLTDDAFFTRSWAVNKQSGTIIIAGHYDSNKNNKYDKSDKNEILIYDLNTLKLKNKI